MLKAIFFDLGSTLWDDHPLILDMWDSAAAILSHRGIPTTVADMEALSRQVIASYSPSLTRAIIWQRLNGDKQAYQEVMAEIAANSIKTFDDPAEFRRLNPLFPETKDVLAKLAPHFQLGVITQHFSEVRQWITYHGICQYFRHMAISNEQKLYKPDPRLFLGACRAIDVAPEECCMVGDRLDNDIFPANRIGMTTVRILKGPYVIQKERYHRDSPDYTISSIGELPDAIMGS